MVETGLCDNKRTVALDDIETHVIGGIEKHLASPDLIAEYVREYQRAWAKLRDSTGKRRAELQKQLADVQADIRIAVDVLLGKPSRAVRERLDALEERRDRLEGALAEVQSAPLVEFHPNAADSYRKKVRDLRAALAAADDENRQEAYRGIRDLVEKIVIKPTGPYKPVDLEIHGRMATLLRASIEETIEEPKSMGALVAGVDLNHDLKVMSLASYQVLHWNVPGYTGLARPSASGFDRLALNSPHSCAPAPPDRSRPRAREETRRSLSASTGDQVLAARRSATARQPIKSPITQPEMPERAKVERGPLGQRDSRSECQTENGGGPAKQELPAPWPLARILSGRGVRVPPWRRVSSRARGRLRSGGAGAQLWGLFSASRSKPLAEG